MAKKVEKTRWDLDKMVPVILLTVFAVGGFVFAVAAKFGQGNVAKTSSATAQQKPQIAPTTASYYDHMKNDIEKQWGSGAANWGPKDLQKVIEANRQATESILQSIQEQQTTRPVGR